MANRHLRKAGDVVWNLLWPLRALWWVITWPIIDFYEYLYPPRIYHEAKELEIALKNASTFQEWSSTALRLDSILPKLYAWKFDMSSRYYRYRAVREQLNAIHNVCEDGDFYRMESRLRTGCRRGVFGIGNPRLFDRLYCGTKFLIEQYVNTVLDLLDSVVQNWEEKVSARERMRSLQNLRNSVGRTALMLQGGSLFGLYHLGVVTELYRQNLLSKLIIGTGTGAVTAGLLAALTDEELEDFVTQSTVIMDSFDWKATQIAHSERDWSDRIFSESGRWFDILATRIKEFATYGCVFDREALQRCVDLMLGDITFEDAKLRTGREVCITIAADAPGTPNLLCYITTPNVLIRSAVRAAMESDFDTAMATVLEKDFDGVVQKWTLDDETPAYRIRRRERDRKAGVKTLLYHDRAMDRARQIFNINHFVTSQARPYFIPFTKQPFSLSQAPRLWAHSRLWLRMTLTKMLQLRARQLMILLPLPMWLQKLLMDTAIRRGDMTIAPNIGLQEVHTLFQNPSKETVGYWISLGEKSVWPCVAAIKIRCSIEFALQRYADQMKAEDGREWFLAQRPV